MCLAMGKNVATWFLFIPTVYTSTTKIRNYISHFKKILIIILLSESGGCSLTTLLSSDRDKHIEISLNDH